MRGLLTGIWSLLVMALSVLTSGCGGATVAAIQPPVAVPTSPAPPPAPPAAPLRTRAIWIGDSLAARGWRGVGIATRPGSFVVTGNGAAALASLTTVDAHGLMPGNYIQLYNVGDAAHQAPLNGAVVPVLATPDANSFTIAASQNGVAMPEGDYSSGYSGQGWLVNSLVQGTDESWLHWLNSRLNGQLVIVGSYAIGGTTSASGVALIPRIAAGPRADVAFIQYCTNDVNATQPPAVADCVSNVERLIDTVVGLGMIAVVVSPPAIGDRNALPVDPASIAKAAALREIRDGLQSLVTRRPGTILLDALNSSADPGDGLSRFRAGYAPVDGIHPSSYGASRMAADLFAPLLTRFGTRDSLSSEAVDDASMNPGGRNLVQNGLMSGTSGSVGSSSVNQISGSAPTGWSIRGIGGTAGAPLVLSTVGGGTTTGMPGSSFDIDIVSGEAGQEFEIGTNGAGGGSFDVRMTAGRWYRCGFELRARSELRHLQFQGQVFLNFGAGGALSVYFMSPTAPAYSNGMLLESGGVLQFLSQPFFLRDVPRAGAYLFISGRLSGPAANHRLSLGRATCQIVDSPYT